MAEKRTPHFVLAEIKTAFVDPARMNRTFVSKQGATALGMGDDDVIKVIQDLNLADFNKSMTSYADASIWQDVYKPTVAGRRLYVKFTLDAGKAVLLISFKEA